VKQVSASYAWLKAMSAVANHSSGWKVAFASRTAFSPLPNGARFRGLHFGARCYLISARDRALGMNAITRIGSRAADRAHCPQGAHDLWFGMTHRQSPLGEVFIEVASAALTKLTPSDRVRSSLNAALRQSIEINGDKSVSRSRTNLPTH
jgi:hypothetical protein